MHEIPTSQVGIRLLEERRRLGLSQAEAAAVCRVSREQWGRYERGAMPNSAVLVDLLGAHFDVMYVLAGKRGNAKGTLSTDEHELLDAYRSTDAEGRASLMRQAKLEALRTRGG